MKGNVLPDRDFFIEALRKEEETGGEGPAIRETCEALSTALHAIPFLFSFFAIWFFPQPSLTRSLRPFLCTHLMLYLPIAVRYIVPSRGRSDHLGN